MSVIIEALTAIAITTAVGLVAVALVVVLMYLPMRLLGLFDN